MFAQHTEFEIVGETNDAMTLLANVREERVDAVVVLTDEPDRQQPGVVSHLLAEYPDLTVLAVLPSGAANIAQRCTLLRTVTAKAPTALASALRDAVKNPCEPPADELSE